MTAPKTQQNLNQIHVIILFIVLGTIYYCYPYPQKAITYELNGGRFGNNLLTYIKAKWISETYCIPLFYKPFPHSDQLELHYKETLYHPDLENFFLNKQKILNLADISTTLQQKNTLYISTFYFGKYSERPTNGSPDKFIELIKEFIKPHTPLNLIIPPSDMFSIALHIRRGGGRDHPESQKKFPDLFPPDSYYIDQIKKIADRFNDKKIYIFIFTDDRNPESIAKKYSSELKNNALVFDYRKGNQDYKNAAVLEDFFSMGLFDCLIRPRSTFSAMAELIGKNKIVIMPQKNGHHWEHGTVTIDLVCTRSYMEK